MLKATLRKGEIVLLEPVPSEWVEGTQLEIDVALEEQPALSLDIDEWTRTMDALCADSTADDEVLMQQGVEDHRAQAKAHARREMGLTG
jgi:hypothetical protein